MTTPPETPAVRVVCPVCGQVDVSAAELNLFVCETNPDLSHYTFTCPDCCENRTRPAAKRTIDVLVANDVAQRSYSPAFLLERKPEIALTTPMVEDEVIYLGLQLEKHNRLAARDGNLLVESDSR